MWHKQNMYVRYMDLAGSLVFKGWQQYLLNLT